MNEADNAVTDELLLDPASLNIDQLSKAVYAYVEATHIEFVNRFGPPKPYDRSISIGDLERRVGAAHGLWGELDSNDWTPRQWHEALTRYAPEQRREALGTVDLSRGAGTQSVAQEPTKSAVQRTELSEDRFDTLFEALCVYINDTTAEYRRRYGHSPDRVVVSDIEERMRAAHPNGPDGCREWNEARWQEALTVHAPAQRLRVLGDLELTDARDAWKTRLAGRLSEDSGPHPVAPEPAKATVRHAANRLRLLSPTQTLEALRSSVSRTRVHVEQTRVACVRGKSEHKAQGSPPLELPSPREEELARIIDATPRARLPASLSGELRAIDSSLAELRSQLVSNPLWIAAAHVEKSVTFTKTDDLLTQDPKLTAAKEAYQKAERELIDAKRAIDQWQDKPAWMRAIQNFIFGSGQSVQSNFDNTASQLVAANASFSALQRDTRYELEALAAQRNADAHDRQSEARTVREALEAPLRAALLERSMSQDIILKGRLVQPLREARINETLEYIGVKEDRGFPVLEFRSERSAYRADAIELDASRENLGLVPGDKIRNTLDADGVRVLVAVERSGHLTIDDRALEGRVGDVEREGDKLLRFQLTDPEGKTCWVVPSKGEDLSDELRGDLAQALVAGNLLRIQNRDVHVLERERSNSLGH